MFAAIIALAAGVIAPATLATQIIGTTVPPYPPGTDDSNGACVGATLATQCDVSIGTLVTPEGAPLVIYAGSTKGHDPAGKAIWLVTDALVYPQMREGDSLGIGSCRFNAKEDSAIIAVARGAPDADFFKVESWSYRLDRASGKFIKLDPAKVDCYNTMTEPD